MPSNKPLHSQEYCQSLSHYSEQGKRFLVAMLVSASVAANASGQSYSITDLGTLGGNSCLPTGLNNLGEVVGASKPLGSADFHPFLYTNDEMMDLGTLGGDLAWATGINDLSQVVGQSSETSVHAFLWEDGQMIDLNPLFKSTSSQARRRCPENR